MASLIPIQNIYYLLIYAWDRLAEGELVDVSGIESTELVDLYAALLLNGLRHLMRRGLDQSYVAAEAEISGIRGRVQVAVTARRMLAQHGRAHCQYDELSVDSLPNRILLATLHRLVTCPSLDETLRDQLRTLSRSLREVSSVPLNKQVFRTVQLHSNNGFYKFLLSVCELILDSSLSTEEHGVYRFRDFIRQPDRMAALFEKFLFNFFRIECQNSDVRRERIFWSGHSTDDPDLRYLPTMETDISIRRAGQTRIIDAKFYQETLQRYFGSETIRSAHLYQLFSYLKNLEQRDGQDARAEGVLIYPVVKDRLRLQYEISGHVIRIHTVDLAQNWKQIRSELMEVVQ